MRIVVFKGEERMPQPHPLVIQLRFTRSEFERALEGISDEDARKRFLPMNCISWIIGHAACGEQNIWVTSMQKYTPLPQINVLYDYGQPASTPPLAEVLEAWRVVTQAADTFLDTMTTQTLQTVNDEYGWSTGSLLQRFIYHYWYHTGEIMAIRQMLGHTDLPEFVGDLANLAPYQPH